LNKKTQKLKVPSRDVQYFDVQDLKRKKKSNVSNVRYNRSKKKFENDELPLNGVWASSGPKKIKNIKR